MKMLFGLAAILAVTGCNGQTPAGPPAGDGAAQPPVANTPASGGMKVKVPTNAWLGRWTGPEGLVLDIAADGGPYSGRYVITSQYTLDDKGVFAGVASLDTIVFKRGGKEFTIRAGNGDATGMKWLAGKTDCLIVAPGEGYCRG